MYLTKSQLLKFYQGLTIDELLPNLWEFCNSEYEGRYNGRVEVKYQLAKEK